MTRKNINRTVASHARACGITPNGKSWQKVVNVRKHAEAQGCSSEVVLARMIARIDRLAANRAK